MANLPRLVGRELVRLVGVRPADTARRQPLLHEGAQAVEELGVLAVEPRCRPFAVTRSVFRSAFSLQAQHSPLSEVALSVLSIEGRSRYIVVY